MSSDIHDRRRQIATGVNIAHEQSDDELKRSAIEALKWPTDSSHARDDALSPREFERLIDASYGINKSRIELETRAVLYLTGRVGLRKGEVTHLAESWVNWSDGVITIPPFQPCTKGQHADEPCGYCRRRAEDRVETNNITHDEAVAAIQHVLDESANLTDADIDAKATELMADVNMELQDALQEQWQPKTPRSARRVPFDFDVRVELTLERFFDRFDGWERSAATVNRRINRLQELTEFDKRLYPHALRATAASYHASRDISVHSLMSIMGWADPGTARAYVSANDEQAAREIRSKHR